MFELVRLILNFADMELLTEMLNNEYWMFTFGSKTVLPLTVSS